MSKVDISKLIDEEEIIETFEKIKKKKKFDDGTVPKRKDLKREKKTTRIQKDLPEDE